MSVPTEFHSTESRTYNTLCISVRQPITEVKGELNGAADVREIDMGPVISSVLVCSFFCLYTFM